MCIDFLVFIKREMKKQVCSLTESISYVFENTPSNYLEEV